MQRSIGSICWIFIENSSIVSCRYTLNARKSNRNGSLLMHIMWNGFDPGVLEAIAAPNVSIIQAWRRTCQNRSYCDIFMQGIETVTDSALPVKWTEQYSFMFQDNTEWWRRFEWAIKDFLDSSAFLIVRHGSALCKRLFTMDDSSWPWHDMKVRTMMLWGLG